MSKRWQHVCCRHFLHYQFISDLSKHHSLHATETSIVRKLSVMCNAAGTVRMRCVLINGAK